MKKVKFLAALAIPAMFAACNNEELALDAPLQNQEIVGAELVGTDISIVVERDGVESRYNGSWETTDLLGLGWIVKTGYTIAQSSTIEPDQNTLFANHMFAMENGVFTTKGNVYKGWHFAYFPYERMDQIGEKAININPTQDCLWEQEGGDRYHERFAISARHFLEAGDLDDNNQLKNEKDFKVEWATNEIIMNLIPSEEFKTSKYLNNLAIQKVTLNTSNKVLAPYAKLNAIAIPPVMNKDSVSIYSSKVTDREGDENMTKKAVLSSLPKILTAAYLKNKKVTAGYTNSIVTDITAEMKTATGGYARIFTLPFAVEGAITSANVTPTIRVDVEGGFFTISKVQNAAAGSLAEANNKALAELVAAYAEGGSLAKVQGAEMLHLNLYPDIFTPYFKEIDDYNEWKTCVNIVNALGYTETQTFTITGDIDVNSTTIAMPKKCGVKVVTSTKTPKVINVNKTLKSWPAGLNTEDVDVIFNANNTISQQINAKTITNNATMTLAAGTASAKNVLTGNITNNGTIVVNKYAQVGPSVVNDGRIEIIYGGIAETAENEEGVIYYTVNGSEPAYQINNLMTEGNVNTFVVNAGVTFNLNNTDVNGTSTDEYTPSAGTAQPLNTEELALVKVELNGGEVVGLKNGVQSNVTAIEVLAGETNKTTDLKATTITVKAGTLTMDASTYYVGTTLYKYELDMAETTAVDVKAGATLVANANTHVATLANEGTVKANSGYVFHFTRGTSNGHLYGEVEECDCNPETPTDYTTLESAVTTALESWKNATDNTVTVAYVVEKIKANTSATTASGKFYSALKAWFDAKVADGLLNSTLPGMASVTTTNIDVYQAMTGTQLVFEVETSQE